MNGMQNAFGEKKLERKQSWEGGGRGKTEDQQLAASPHTSHPRKLTKGNQ